MIDYERKIVILHPPKTGGQALMSALGMPHGKGGGAYFAYWRHDTLGDIWGKLPELREWPVYLLVRNPFARMVSYYHYLVQTEIRRPTPVIRYVRDFASCEQFLSYADLHVLRAAAQTKLNGTMESCAFYATVNGEYQAHVVPIHMERLTEDAQASFGITAVPLINASEHLDWHSYYTPLRRRRVVEYLHEDFERYGYEEDA